jgi:flagellar hook assembly protein FlgD
VKLEIYGLDGKRIKTLTNRIQSAGEYSVIWDATDNNNKPVTPGIYFYKIDTDGIQSTERIVLIRSR